MCSSFAPCCSDVAIQTLCRLIITDPTLFLTPTRSVEEKKEQVACKNKYQIFQRFFFWVHNQNGVTMEKYAG